MGRFRLPAYVNKQANGLAQVMIRTLASELGMSQAAVVATAVRLLYSLVKTGKVRRRRRRFYTHRNHRSREDTTLET